MINHSIQQTYSPCTLLLTKLNHLPQMKPWYKYRKDPYPQINTIKIWRRKRNATILHTDAPLRKPILIPTVRRIEMNIARNWPIFHPNPSPHIIPKWLLIQQNLPSTPRPIAIPSISRMPAVAHVYTISRDIEARKPSIPFEAPIKRKIY